MNSDRKGKLILKSVPGGEVERKVIAYLTPLMKNISPELLAAKIKKAPLILSRNITAEQGLKIAASLKKIGANAAFVPHTQEEALPKRTPMAKPTGQGMVAKSPSPSKSPAPTIKPSQPRRMKWVRVAFASLFLIFSLSLLAWRLYPHLVHQGSDNEIAQAKTTLPRIDFTAFRPWQEETPSIMAVDPQDMYQTFLHQYRWRPDSRVVKAFEVLAEHFGEHRGQPLGESPYRAGEVLSNGKEIMVPLQKEGRVIAEVRVPLPMTFSRTLSALNEWVEAMEGRKRYPQLTRFRTGSWKELEAADADINMVDPRYIMNGLTKLELLWHRNGPDPRILRSAARGYAMLLMALFPDKMNYADIFAAYGLSFLVLAKRMNPDLPLTSEEALLAMNMGYTAHASALLHSNSVEAIDPVNKVFQAYIQQDLQTLESLDIQDANVLGSYLLARLYRKMYLYGEAEKAATSLLKDYPYLYPVLVETISSGNLATAKVLTILYPMDILARLETTVTEESPENKVRWEERFKGFAGEESVGNISFTQFEGLLDKWQPLGPDGDRGFLFDEQRVKTAFRILYTDALFLRFNVLMNRWGVVDKAGNYIELLLTEDKNHPLVMEMQAELYGELGRRKEADAICAKVIKHPKTPGELATSAFYNVDDYLAKIRLAPAVAHSLDGRPESFFDMGTVFQRVLNFDFAEQYYSSALARNPYYYSIYVYLAQITGSDELLSSAIIKFPFSFTLMEKAGDYFKAKKSRVAKGKALECYDLAIKLVPTRKPLPLRKAAVLKQLDRPDEAVGVLKAWLREYGQQHDLTTLSYKASLAEIYLDMGNPNLAVTVLADEIDSYKADVLMVGARAYEETGQDDLAEQVYLKAVNRYPTADHVLSGTAAFYWRHGNNEEAAKLIGQGRNSMGNYHQWYFTDFLEVFAQSSEEQILAAVDLLAKYGATYPELNSLAFYFRGKERPAVAYKILQKSPTQLTMQRLEKCVHSYKVLRDWQGEEEALAYLHKAVPPKLREPLTIVLYSQGIFDVILTELNNPKAYSKAHREFYWLQRLIAWLALEKNPSELETEIMSHYKESWQNKLGRKLKRGPHEYYYDIGRYLLGMLSRDELLSQVRTAKQRCEFVYYIGLSERLKADFPDAANWYHLCLETLLSNNGEFHWAQNELFWWSYMGLKNRHRLPGDDIRAYRARYRPRT
jgi:tetratricopeptide (TPR) repeat protein